MGFTCSGFEAHEMYRICSFVNVDDDADIFFVRVSEICVVSSNYLRLFYIH